MTNLVIENKKWDDAGLALWSTEVDNGHLCPVCFDKKYISPFDKLALPDGDSDSRPVKICPHCGYKEE